jgi:hypothetical protein
VGALCGLGAVVVVVALGIVCVVFFCFICFGGWRVGCLGRECLFGGGKSEWSGADCEIGAWKRVCLW